jgi:hypothetical protein
MLTLKALPFANSKILIYFQKRFGGVVRLAAISITCKDCNSSFGFDFLLTPGFSPGITGYLD